MKTYAGIDLHSSNNYIGIIDAKDKRLYSRRHDNRIDDVLKVLGKFKASLQGVVVESTYNWYWLVDGLMDQGYVLSAFLFYSQAQSCTSASYNH
jgi:transposase